MWYGAWTLPKKEVKILAFFERKILQENGSNMGKCCFTYTIGLYIIRCEKFCSEFELALRGHDESEKLDNPRVLKDLTNYIVAHC